MTFKEWWEENQYKEFYRFVSSTTAREIWQAGQNNCRKKMTFDEWWESTAPYEEKGNPYTLDSASFWAWQGWHASRENV